MWNKSMQSGRIAECRGVSCGLTTRAGTLLKRLTIVTLLLLPRVWASCSRSPCEALLPDTPVTAPITSSNLGNQSLRIEFRLVGVNWTSSARFNPIVTFGGMGITLFSSTTSIYFVCGPDVIGTGCGNYNPTINFAASASNDILFRFTRNISTMQQTLEVYDAQTGTNLITSGAASYTAPITSRGSSSAIQSSGVSIGSANASGNIAFLRAYSSVVPIGTLIPVAVSTPANLGDWEFNNSGVDSSSLGQNFTGAFSYSSTPTYSPACSAGPQTVQAVGSIFNLNGSNSYPLDGGTTLNYAWTYLTGSDGVNQGLTINSPSSATTTTTPSTQFGSADFRLTVTDSSGNSTNCSINNGVIIANSTGVINLTAEGLDPISQKFIGPMIAFGQNTWPWADTVQQTTLAGQINNLQNYYTPYWRTSLGISSITAGSASFTVSSGGLAPCGGGSAPLNGAWFVWIYTGTDSLMHYTMFPVVSCNSATSITVNWGQNGNIPATAYPSSAAAPWPTCSSACTEGWNWGYSDSSSTPGTYSPQYQLGLWTYSGAPGNYYDNAKDFYNAYWRTGIDTYLYWFQQLSDWFWEQPQMDQGYNCSQLNPVTSCFEPVAWRNMAMNGIFLRALEQGPGSSKWAGIHVVETSAAYVMGTNVPSATPFGVVDEREQGYTMSVLAMCALSDPNATSVSGCKSALKSSLTFWAASQRLDLGNGWGNFYYNTSSAGATSITSLGGAGTACVVLGSNIVTGTGTNWTTALYAGGTGISIWFFDGNPANVPATNAAGDSDMYTITVNSPTSLTLDRPYDGTSGCTSETRRPHPLGTGPAIGPDKGFVVGYPEGTSSTGAYGGFAGWGDQPVYDGHLAQSFFLSAQAMIGFDAPSQALFNQFGDTLVQRVINYGMNPGSGGLYNGIFMASCSSFPILSSNVPCYPFNQAPDGDRVLSMELARAFAMDYQLFGSATVKSAMDLFMTQMWSKPGVGGPTGDGFYLDQYDVGGLFVSGLPVLGTAPKWTGQQCGYTEGCSIWAAARQGNAAIAGTKVAGAASVAGTVVIK